MKQSKSKYHDRVMQSVDFLDRWNQGKKAPDIAIVLGSGLSQAIPNYSQMPFLSFQDIPGFKPTHVPGHSGELRFGKLSVPLDNGQEKTRDVAFLHGRNHAYEGNDPAEVVHNVRSLITWGVKGIVLTNASGCLNKDWDVGKMMLITDHINGTGLSPTVGDYGLDFGPRFVDMAHCYTPSWQLKFQETAAKVNEELYSGIYYGVLGSQYETAAEIAMMRAMGASAVGMSTVLESIAIKQMGAKLAGISCLTNYGVGLNAKALTHEDVVSMGKKFASNIANIVLNTVVELEV